MSWSYDATDLDTGTPSGRLNSVRYLVGDTNFSSGQVQDEEINFSLVQTNDNIYSAGAFVASTIASKYSRLVDTKLDGSLESNYSTLAKSYRILSSDLKSLGQKYGSSSIGIFFGGTLISSINSVRGDTDRVPSSFSMDRFRFGTTGYETDYVE